MWPTVERRNGEPEDNYRLRSEQVQRLDEWRALAHLSKEQEVRVLAILAEGERMNIEAWDFAEKTQEEHDSAKRLVQSLQGNEITTPEVLAQAAEEVDTDPLLAGKEVEAWVDGELKKVLNEQQFYRWKRTFPLYWSLFSRSLQVFTWNPDADVASPSGT